MIRIRICEGQTLSVGIPQGAAPIGVSVPPARIELAGRPEAYDGPYEVTPSDAVQTLITADRLAAQNIIIHPVPSDYGKIVWNGSTMLIM